MCREFRLEVIAVLVNQYGTLAQPDYSNVCFGLQYLNRPVDVSRTLDNLCRGRNEINSTLFKRAIFYYYLLFVPFFHLPFVFFFSSKFVTGTSENALQAYQIAFDLQETENQGFVMRVASNFKGLIGERRMVLFRE